MRRTTCNDGWMVRAKVNRWAALAGESTDWTPVTLPHDAMIEVERTPEATAATGFFPGGIWEYRRLLDVTPEDAAGEMILEFEGVYRDAKVSVNGVLAAHRPYGYSRFFVPIGHLVRSGTENEVLVEARAHADSRWYSGAGIYRNVWMLRSAPVHLAPEGLDVRTPEVDDDGAVVTVASVVRNGGRTSASVTLRVEVVDAEGTNVASDDSPVTMRPDDAVTVRRRLFVDDPHRWGPDDPYLYSCRVTLLDEDVVLDEDSTRFGIRSLALDPRRGLRINGQPVLLRGACVHHDNGLIGAATIDRADERRVELLKAAGFNAIRSAHNPMSTAMLDACDRLGMLVMDETFDVWTQTKSDDDYALRFPDWWEADLEAMVLNDRNHPSVVFYSVGNEITDGSALHGLEYGRALSERVRSLDDTRFVTQAVSGLQVAPEALDAIRDTADDANVDEETGINTALTSLADFLSVLMRAPVVGEKSSEVFSYLDVAGYNYMESRFDLDAEQFPHRVIVATESHPSRIDVCWAGVEDHANVIGDFTWTGWDYLGEAGVGRVEYGTEPNPFGMTGFLAGFPYLTAWCGDLDITGHRRPQSYFREIVWGRRTDPYLAVRRPEHLGEVVVHSGPWSWSDVVSSWSWPDHAGVPVIVEVYSGSDEVELLLNGTSVGRAPTGSQHRYRAEFEVAYEAGVLEAIAWSGGSEVGRTTLRSAEGSVQLDARVDRSEIDAGPFDLAFVEITLVDASGSLYNTVDRRVAVEIEGPGVLQGLGSARPDTEERFDAGSCTTFDGRALAVVRPTGAGTITVSVAADDCTSQSVRVEAVSGS